MQVDLNGKTAVITGAAGALGSAMAVMLAKNGAKVAVCDMAGSKGEDTVSAIQQAGGTAHFFAFDVTDRQQAKTAMADIAKVFGGIDILVNNAGINVGPDKRFPIHQFDDDSWDKIIAVDLDGVYNCSKAAIPHMIKSGGGSVINISSVVGMVPFRKQCAFTAAKGGVINFSKAMAIELAEENIRVNVIAPGSIAMDLTAKLWSNDSAMEGLLAHIPQHKQGRPDDIANAVLFLSADEAGYITGTVLNVDGGWLCGYARDF